MPPAHIGHTVVNLLYFAPVLLVIGMLGYKSLQDRHARRRQRP